MRWSVLFLLVCAGCVQVEKGPSLKEGFVIESKRCEAMQDKSLFVWGEWPEEKWWEIFCDPCLNELVTTALAENFSLQSTEARIRQAKAEAEVMRARLLPQLNGIFNMVWAFLGQEARTTFPNLSENFQFYTGGFNISYEFDFWGKNKKMFEAAFTEMQIQELMWRQARINLAVQIVVEYYNLQATKERLHLLKKVLGARKVELELVTLRDKYRIDSGIDVAKLKGEIAGLEKGISAVSEELELGKSLLATYLGHNPTEDLGITYKWNPEYKPFELPDGIGTDLLARRADIAAQMGRVLQSAKLIGVAVTEFMPNITLTGFPGFLSPTINNWISAPGFSVGMLPQIAIPLFQGGRIRANLQAKVEAHASAVHAYNEQLLQAANEAVSCITQLQGVNAQLAHQNTEYALTAEVYRLVDVKYQRGINSLLTKLQAEEDLLLSQIRRVELERMKIEAIILLIKALGGGFHGATS